jgi:hypothetical protein
MKQHLIFGFATMLILGLVPDIRADIVNYGDFTEGEVDFLDVTEVTPQSCLFFGAPTQSDNALVFSSTTADGSSLTSTSRSTSSGFDFASGALSLSLEANPGMAINQVRIRHFGSIGTFGNDSLAMIGSVGFVTAGSDVYSDSFQTVSEGNQLGTLFDNSYTISFPATQNVILSIQDQLFTVADDGPGFAFVSTQGVIIETFSITSVPEPGFRLGFALLACCFFTRRRKRAVRERQRV